MADRWCDEVRELIPELALGVAPGDERARALAHVDRCPACRALLERSAATADELLLLAPEHEPPAGFDARVLAAMRPRRRGRVAVVLAVAAALVIAAGTLLATRWVYADDAEVAAQYRHTLDVADGSYLRSGVLATSTGVEAGHVFAYEGRPSWIFMTVEGAPSGAYAVTLVTDDGGVHDLGWCRVRNGTGAWGTAVDVPIDSIDHLEMSWAGTTLTARLLTG
jgi:hypothetical protein